MLHKYLKNIGLKGGQIISLTMAPTYLDQALVILKVLYSRVSVLQSDSFVHYKFSHQ
jgi:hypothetical protein